MREIKFRAWDEEENKMYEWGDLLDLWMCFWEIQDMVFWQVTYKLMQLTWVLDKNWKKIYEWDVLIITLNADGWSAPKNWKIITGVEWDRLCYMCWEEKSLYNYSTMSGVTIEIIWNIYENPELLNLN